MPDRDHIFLDEWHRVVAEKDVAAIGALLSDDVSLGAPPYWTRIEGRRLVGHLLGLILGTIEDFTYHREWQAEGELALEFTGRVGKRELQGIDLISLDAQLKVRRIDVLIRPVNALITLRETIGPQMAAFIGGQASQPSP